MEENDPLWKRILMSEMLWVMAAVAVILGAAFLLATSGSPDQASRSVERSR